MYRDNEVDRTATARILVVDVAATSTEGKSPLPANGDFTVVRAASYYEAKHTLERDLEIDLVILMAENRPDEILDFAEHIKSIPKYEWIPVIAFVNKPQAESISSYLKIGIDDIIIIPFEQDSIECRIGNLCRAGRPTVLVVDDDETVLALLETIISFERYRVVTATNLDDAADLLKQRDIDAVISDIFMPGKTGLELLAYIKREYAHIPVLLITGFADEYSPSAAKAAGADGFLQKPFRNVELLRKLRSLIVHQKRRSKSIP